jgi:type I pantothenate kinase
LAVTSRGLAKSRLENYDFGIIKVKSRGWDAREGQKNAGRGGCTPLAGVGPIAVPLPPVTTRYLHFARHEWKDLRAATPLTIREKDLEALRGINERMSLDEVVEVYLPLTRLLNLYVSATQTLHRVSATFLGTVAPKVPYVIGVAGSVAVGKSTFARVLQALLSRWPDHPNVDLVTTDGFLHPNATLVERNILNRKGFPESYDVRRLLTFMRELKSGAEEVRAPVYSHVAYDVVPGQELAVRRPDILILEGLNVLQVNPGATEFVSDYFDFSIYVDADEADVQSWYVDRFLKLRETVFRDPTSYFRHYAHLSRDEAVETALGIWREINGKNLEENILPTRSRASLVLRKGKDHTVTEVSLRKL